MLATSKSKDSLLVGVHQLLEYAYQWCKRKTFKARQKLEPWLNEVGSDLKQGTLKTLRHYREKLEELLKVTVESSKAKFEQWKEEHPESFLTSIFLWGYVIANRVVLRPLKRFRGWLSRQWGKIMEHRHGPTQGL